MLKAHKKIYWKAKLLWSQFLPLHFWCNRRFIQKLLQTLPICKSHSRWRISTTQTNPSLDAKFKIGTLGSKVIPKNK